MQQEQLHIRLSQNEKRIFSLACDQIHVSRNRVLKFFIKSVIDRFIEDPQAFGITRPIADAVSETVHSLLESTKETNESN